MRSCTGYLHLLFITLKADQWDCPLDPVFSTEIKENCHIEMLVLLKGHQLYQFLVNLKTKIIFI